MLLPPAAFSKTKSDNIRLSNLGDNDVPIFKAEYNDEYQKYKDVALIIEGPEFELDYSYFLIFQCDDLKDLEKGIPLSRLEEEAKSRDLEMEFRVLTRVNCHKIHY